MQPFRELVKANSKFTWDDNLDKIFNDSKAKIVSLVEEGIRTFDTSRRTCLQDLSSIPDDHISSLKEKTFRYQFSIQFCPGKLHRGPDAVSRNPSVSMVSLISIIRQPASIKDLNSLITLQEIQDACKSDQSYQELAKTIVNGFPKKRNETTCIAQALGTFGRLETAYHYQIE